MPPAWEDEARGFAACSRWLSRATPPGRKSAEGCILEGCQPHLHLPPSFNPPLLHLHLMSRAQNGAGKSARAPTNALLNGAPFPLLRRCHGAQRSSGSILGALRRISGEPAFPRWRFRRNARRRLLWDDTNVVPPEEPLEWFFSGRPTWTSRPASPGDSSSGSPRYLPARYWCRARFRSRRACVVLAWADSRGGRWPVR